MERMDEKTYNQFLDIVDQLMDIVKEKDLDFIFWDVLLDLRREFIERYRDQVYEDP